MKKDIKIFLEKTTKKKKLIVIYGPTASGKTKLSLDVAKTLRSQIIGADSRQIYVGMDIGTGKITKKQKGKIIHHLIDHISPTKKYSVGQYKKDSKKILESIWSKGKIPILCGGTGLYIDAIIYNFSVPKVPENKELRDKLEKEAVKKGKEYVHKKLQKIDPAYAKTLHPNNLQYVIRGIEVKMLTGKSKLDFKKEKRLRYETLFLTPYNNLHREKLYENINIRVQEMFDDGLVEEVETLIKKYGENAPGLEAIGYSEVISYLRGDMSLDECIELVQKNSRNYAKRQVTWFRKYDALRE